MSNNDNRFEELNSNEDRSEEESSMNDDDRDFIVAESSNLGGRDDASFYERELNELLNSRTGETQGDGRSVTILNTSDGSAREREGREEKGGARLGLDGDSGQQRSGGEEDDGRSRVRGHRILQRGDLSSSGTNSTWQDASTVPETAGRTQGVVGHESGAGWIPRTPVGPGMTRVIRQSTVPRLDPLGNTVPVGRGDRPTLPTVQEGGGKGTQARRFQAPLDLDSRKVEGQGTYKNEERRGVVLAEDFYGEEEEPGAIIPGSRWEVSTRNLEESEVEVHDQLVGIEQRYQMLENARRNRSDLIRDPDSGATDGDRERLDVAERVVSLQTSVVDIIRNPHELATLGNAEATLWADRCEDVKRVMELGRRADDDTRVRRYSLDDVRQLVSNTGNEMSQLFPLIKRLPEESLTLMCERHDNLVRVLEGGPDVTRAEKIKEFGPDKANSIVDWHVRAVVAAEEINRLQTALDYSLLSFESHLCNHPVKIQEVKAKSKTRGCEDSTLTATPSIGVFSQPQAGRGGSNYDNLGTQEADDSGWEKVEHGRKKSTRASRLKKEDAAELGFQWRMGSAKDQERDDLSDNKESADDKSTKSERRKPTEKYGVRPKELVMDSNSVDDERSVVSTIGSMVWDRALIKETMGEYIMADLEASGMGLSAAVRIIVENLPLPGEAPKKGYEHKIVKTYGEVANSIKPKIENDFFNMYEWLKDFNSKANEYKFTILVRLRMFEKHGGMKEDKEYSIYRDRIMKVMSEIERWMPEYDITRDEADYEYWLYVWVDVCLKWVKEFYQPLEETKIEEGARALMRESKYRLINGPNALNDQWIKIDQMYKDVLLYLENMDSALKDDPGFAMRLVKEDLMRKERGALGDAMEDILSDHIKMVVRKPEAALPIGHGLEESELRKIKRGGVVHIPQDIYLLVLQRIVREGAEGAHNFKIHSAGALNRFLEAKEEKKPSSKKKEAAAMAAVTSGGKGGPMGNTQGGRGQGGNSIGGRGSGRGPGTSGGTTDTACAECGMFCPKEGRGCMWTDKNGKLDVAAFAAGERNRFFTPAGVCQPSRSCMHKLEGFHFERARVPVKDPVERSKILAQVRAAILAYSAQPAVKQVNFAEQKTEEKSLQEKFAAMTKKTEKIEKILAQTTKQLSKGGKKKPAKLKRQEQRKAERRAKRKAEADSVSDSDETTSQPSLFSDTDSESEEEESDY